MLELYGGPGNWRYICNGRYIYDYDKVLDLSITKLLNCQDAVSVRPGNATYYTTKSNSECFANSHSSNAAQI